MQLFFDPGMGSFAWHSLPETEASCSAGLPVVFLGRGIGAGSSSCVAESSETTFHSSADRFGTRLLLGPRDSEVAGGDRKRKQGLHQLTGTKGGRPRKRLPA